MICSHSYRVMWVLIYSSKAACYACKSFSVCVWWCIGLVNICKTVFFYGSFLKEEFQNLFRVELFFLDFDEIWIYVILNLQDFICLTSHHQFFISTCCSLIEEGGDWDRRNRLKVYQGTYCIVIRDFKAAANFFLDTISTFTSYELMDYETFVRYTVYISMISLPRNELRDKVCNFLNKIMHVTWVIRININTFQALCCSGLSWLSLLVAGCKLSPY
jgi:hypothetical protein